VDLDRRKLHVRHQLQRLDGRWQFVEPKSDAGQRSLTLPPTLVTELRAHRTRQLEERLAAGDRWQDWNLVFPSTLGTPIQPANLTHRVQMRLVRAGLPPMRVHDLRHAAVSLMLAQGVPLAVASKLIGHSQVSLTADLYGHLIEDMADDAAERMEAVFAGIGSG